MNYATRKDQLPENTVLKIKTILKSINIEPTIRHVCENEGNIYSLFLELGDTGIGVNGKGVNKNFAEASAYGELMERLQGGVLIEPWINIESRSAKKISKKELLKFIENNSDEHFKNEPNMEKILDKLIAKKTELCMAGEYFDVFNKEIKVLPESLILELTGTNGLCAGNTPLEAICQGICEILERYALKQIMLSNYIPLKISEEYYKNLSSLMLPSGNVSGSLIEILNSAGTTVNYGFTGNSDLAARGVITKKNGLKYLVADINGSSVGTVGYIRITKVDPFDVTSSSIPFIDKRIYTGSGTYKFSGTAQNSGNSYSTVLTLNLTNNSEIPEGATVKSANTTGTMSTNVGGVQHMLGPGSAGWLASSATNGRASFDFSPYNIYVKNLWQFKYYQSAYSNTRLSNLSLRINWEYDINNTNYELFY